MSSPDFVEAFTATKVIDIETTGRRTGEPRRIEIWYYVVEGGLYLTGAPGPS